MYVINNNIAFLRIYFQLRVIFIFIDSLHFLGIII